MNNRQTFEVREIALKYAISTGAAPDKIIPTAQEFADFLHPMSPHTGEKPSPFITRPTIVRFIDKDSETGCTFCVHSVCYKHGRPVECARLMLYGISRPTLEELQMQLKKWEINISSPVINYEEHFGPEHAG